jgi:signal transduction histidine kinase
MDERRITMMRLLLATAALGIIYIDPSEPDRYVDVTYTALTLYVAYSAMLWAYAWRRMSLALTPRAHWVDVGWYVLLIGLSSGTHSIFFFFFFFAILVASFQWGFRSGLGVTLVSATLFSAVGFVTAPAEPAFELNRFLLRPLALLGLGYLMAYWGGYQITLMRRLTLLKDVSTLANPRFGVDHTLGMLLAQLRAFYDAEACLLVMADPLTGGHSLRRVGRRDPASSIHDEPIAARLAHRLLALPATQAVVTRGVPRLWPWGHAEEPHMHAYDVETGARQVVPPQVYDVLEAASCLTVPWRQHHETRGRLYLTAARRRAFKISDVHFLLQLLAQVLPTIENVQLVDQLAAAAAKTERERMAHDLHDGVIQPYVGLQLGLLAVCDKLAAGRLDIQADLTQLLNLTNLGIADLYRYTGGLRGCGDQRDSLLPAVQRFAARFAQTTGIAVHVEASTALSVHDRLAAEVLHIVLEGLSNVRRHTRSTRVTLSLACANGHLSLRIANTVAAGAVPAPFVPRSITARAAALGGRTSVERCADDGTVVVVDIPL